MSIPRERLVVGNWKMNLGGADSVALTQALGRQAAKLNQTQAWVAPSAPFLAETVHAAKGTAIAVGAQNCYWEAKGAFTGEISVPMIRETGATFVIVGHSERRQFFGETPQSAAKRAHAAIAGGLTCIFCIGELLADREAGRTLEVLTDQLTPLTEGLPQDWEQLLILAYEPVWAIGTGKVAGAEDITGTHEAIAAWWEGAVRAESPPILYGGSVTPENFGEIVRLPRVAGGLVGGASLSAEKFGALLTLAEG